MDMTYEEMLREMEAYFAASAPTPTVRVRSVTRHEEMLERLCGKNAQDDMLLAALRKMFSAEEVETSRCALLFLKKQSQCRVQSWRIVCDRNCVQRYL